MKMNQALDGFMIMKKANFKEETARYYKGKVPTIRNHLGDKEVSEIRDVDIANFLMQLKKRNPKISTRTLRKYVDIVISIVNKDRKTDDKINYKKPKVKTVKIRRVSDQNIDKILTYYKENLHYVNNHKYYLMIKLFLDTGVRINELVNIKMKNINFDMNSIYLDVTKIDDDRTVYFTKDTKQLLLSYIANFIDNHEYLFYGQNGTGHMRRDSIYKTLDRLQKRLGIEQSISPHKWRHTFGTKALRKTGDIEVVRQLLGHKNITTTQMYLDYEDEYIKKVYDKFMN